MFSIQKMKLDHLLDENYPEWKYKFFTLLDKVLLTRFRYKLKSGYDYFKLGWNSYNFDSSYALEEFVWKLGRVRKCLMKNNIFEGCEEECAKIKRVEELITRVLNDDYYPDIFEKPITEKYGVRKYSWGETDKETRTVPWLSWREKQTPEDEEKIRELEHEALTKADDLRNKEWEEAIDIIKNNIFKWWDVFAIFFISSAVIKGLYVFQII